MWRRLARGWLRNVDVETASPVVKAVTTTAKEMGIFYPKGSFPATVQVLVGSETPAPLKARPTIAVKYTLTRQEEHVLHLVLADALCEVQSAQAHGETTAELKYPSR